MVFLHHAFPHQPEFWTKLGMPSVVATILAGIGATGAFGVSLFFVLSAYLITELLLREKELVGTLDVKSFYVRRILRIWPLYFFFLALAVGLQWVVPGQHMGWRAGVAFSALAGNWYIVFIGFPSSVIFPLWSVSIEEQFYLTWPLIVRRVSQMTMVAFAVGLLGVATAARFYLGAHHRLESEVWCNTLVQLDPIAAGILIAVLLRGAVPQLSRLARVAMAVAGVACIVSGALYFGIKNDPLTTTRIVLGYPMVAIGGVLLLLAVLREGAKPAKASGLSGPDFLRAVCLSRAGAHDLRLRRTQPDSEPGEIWSTSLCGARPDRYDGGDFVSLVGDAIPEAEAAVHVCAVAAGRVRANRSLETSGERNEDLA